MKKILIYSLLVMSMPAVAQLRLTEKEAVAVALQNHPSVAAAQMRMTAQTQLNTLRKPLQQSQLYHSVTADPDLGLLGTATFGLQHNFNTPKGNRAFRAQQTAQSAVLQADLKLNRQQTIKQVREIYQHLSYLESKALHLQRLDSLWQRMLKVSQSRYGTGEINKAELAAMQHEAGQVRLERETLDHELGFDRIVLQQLLGAAQEVQPIVEPLTEASYSMSDTSMLVASATVELSAAMVQLAQSNEQQVRAQKAPVPVLGLYGQVLGDGQVFPGWYVGIQAPLARKNLQTQARAAQLQIDAAKHDRDATLLSLQNELAHLLHEVEKYETSLRYYNTQGRTIADELVRSGEAQYRSGEADFSDFLLSVQQATQLHIRHIDDVLGLRLTMIELDMLLSKQN